MKEKIPSWLFFMALASLIFAGFVIGYLHFNGCK